MSLKELYKVMFSDNQKSREEFFSNSSEEASSFEAEAQEGFESVENAQEGLSRLDRKFGYRSSFPSIFFGTALIGICVLGIWFFSQPEMKHEPSTDYFEEPILTAENDHIDKTDLILPEKFDQLIESPEENVENVSSLIQEQKSIQEKMERDSSVSFKIDVLPTMPPVKTEITEIQKELTVKRRGKEISYHDFILLDYKGLRHKSEMEIDRLTLSGTAASKENVASGDFQNEAWRKELVSYDAYIEKTAYFLKMGSFKNALTRFDIILQHYPDDLNALFYSGFALYNLGQFEKAKEFFILGLQNPYTNFDEECAWYYALSLEANGETKQAQKLFGQIAQSTSFYKPQAQKKMAQKK